MMPRRGIALFAALSVMAVIALLVGGIVASSTLAQRSSSLAAVDVELNAASDFALASALDSSLADLPFGIGRTMSVSAGRITSTISATRLRDDVLWLIADSRTVGGTAGRRRTNLVMRWRRPSIPPAPIISRGHVRLGSRVTFAADTTGEADCRATNAQQVILAPGASLTTIDSVAARTDSLAADSATYLLRSSQRVFRDTGSRVMHVQGDTTISAGRIDGILLVDGRVIITGPVAIGGLVVARGAIDARTGRLTLDGALLSFDAPVTGQFAIDLGDALIRHSPCVIAREWRRILPLRPVNGRSWAEIF